MNSIICIRIGIFVDERELASALANRLAYNQAGISITILEEPNPKTDFDCLLFNIEIDSSSISSCIDMLDLREYVGRSVTEILNQIKELYAKRNPNTQVSFYNKRPVHIAFLGISGGAGTSSIALGVARQLSRYKEKRVLYLSFEDFESDELYENKEESTKNSNDIVYYLLQGRSDAVVDFFERFTFKDEYGVERLSPSSMRNELSSLNITELHNLLSIIWGTGRYEYIILDLGNNLNERTKVLCELSTYLLLIDHATSIKNFAIDIIKVELEAIKPDLNIIQVMNHGNELAREDYDEKIFIIEEQSKEISLANSFGISIKNIVEAFDDV